MTLVAEPATGPDAVDEMTAESNRRISLMDAAAIKSKPRADSPVGGTSSGEKPEGDSVTTGSAAKDPVEKPDSPKPASEVVAVPDLSFLDEKHRSFFEKAPKETLDWLKDKLGSEAGLRWSDYTQKTMAVKAQEKALAARQADLDWVDLIDKDPEALQALRDLAERRKSGKPATPAEDDYDPITATPEQRKAREDAIEERASEKAYKRLKAERDGETSADTERRSIAVPVLTALGALDDKGNLVEAGTKGWTGAQIEEAFADLGGWDGMRALAKARRVEFTKDYVVATLQRHLPPPTKPPEAKQDSPNGAAVSRSESAGASSIGRGSGGAPPVVAPAFMQKGKAPSTLEERMAESLFIVNTKRAKRGLPPLSD